MAYPIQPTPILKGKDAERFLARAKANEKKMVSKAQIKRDLKILVAMASKQNIN